jgi:creatinine amidohydrolase
LTPEILRWDRLTKTQFDRIDRARAVVIVTSSPMEVHGPHLPLGTDVMEGDALAVRLVKHLPPPHNERTFIHLPPLWVAGDPLAQPGSIYFRASTVERVLLELGGSLAAQGFREVLVSNFHGSPRHFLAMERACERVSRARGIRMIAIFSTMLSRFGGSDRGAGEMIAGLPGFQRADLEGDAHAGLIETANILALHPDLVDPCYASLPRDCVPTLPVDRASSFARAWRSAKAAVNHFRSKTYAGAPARATPALGEHILEALAKRAAETYAEVLDGKLAPTECHSPLWSMQRVFLSRWLAPVLDRLLGYTPPR